MQSMSKFQRCFWRNREKIQPKIHRKSQGALVTTTIFKENTTVGGLPFPDPRTNYGATVTKMCGSGRKADGETRRMEQHPQK